jgi:hypothetical protein
MDETHAHFSSQPVYIEEKKLGKKPVERQLTNFDLEILISELNSKMDIRDKKIAKLEKSIDILIKHIMYRPGGNGAIEAQKEFETLSTINY